MTNEQIRNEILTICRNSELADLDPDIFTVFPENRGQIGEFFILDDCLYHGEISGVPEYWPIGKCSDINKILYRLSEEDRIIEFCFEFSDMLLVLEHCEFKANKTLCLIQGENHIYNEAEILSILKKKL